MMKNARIFALFALSVTLIAFELAIMRIFSVASWSGFGSMVISIALLGFGVAGTLLTFMQQSIRKNPELWLKASALAFTPSIALAHILSQAVPFNPVLIVSQKIQFLWIGCYYLLYAIPFFVGACFIGVAFTVIAAQAHRIYFWNMAGSGLGGFFLLICMWLLPTKYLILPVLILSSAAALLLFLESGSKAQKLRGCALSAGLCFCCVASVLLWGNLRISPFKSSQLAKLTFSDLQSKHSEYGPLGEMEIMASSQFHFAPGLSDNAIFYLDQMPQNAYWGLYIDGNGPVSIMRKLTEKEEAYINFLPMSAAYQILNEPRVLLLKLGGGFNAFTALYNGARRITIAEPNERLVKIMRDVPAVSQFNQQLLKDSKIKVFIDEPRAFCTNNPKRYDLVEMSLVDSVGLSQSLGYPIEENYDYTAEAIQSYLSSLSADGILSITVWNHIEPPRNVPKLLSTVIQALQNRKIPDTGKHLYIFHLMYSTATVLVKNSAFTQTEIQRLNDFCRLNSFEVIYHSGIADRTSDLNAMLQGYQLKYSAHSQKDTEKLRGLTKRNPGDLYYHTVQHLLSGKAQDLYSHYLFDITPASDNRPYFSSYLKPEKLPLFLDKLDSISEEWGYLLLLGTLFQALIFGLLIIIIPVLGQRKTVFQDKKGLIGVILYYSCLGLAYMLVEIFLLQKLVFFLGNPIYSASIVITSMLVLSGIGSLFSRRFIKNPRTGVRIIAGIIAAALLSYIFALPFLLKATLGMSVIIKIFLSVLFIAPSAFFMGMLFPAGLSHLSQSRPQLIPWAWGTNGALSVSGSVLARIVSIHYGFAVVLLLAALLYCAAGVLFPINCAGRDNNSLP